MANLSEDDMRKELERIQLQMNSTTDEVNRRISISPMLLISSFGFFIGFESRIIVKDIVALLF